MKKILIVDDERKIRRIYLSLLKAEGFEAIDASNLHEAIETLKREEIALVLLDINMPEGNGSKLYEIIKRSHKGVKVIVTSVYPLNEQKAVIKDAQDYYDKSQKTEVLLAKVKRVLRDRSEARKGE